MAIEVYSRQARNVENEKRAIEIRIRAERRCGELLADMEKAKAARGNQYTGPLPREERSKTLADFGISANQSSRWQKLAAVPEEEFEATFRQPGKPSTNGILTASASPKKQNAVDDDAFMLPVDHQRAVVVDRVGAPVSGAVGQDRVAAAVAYPVVSEELEPGREAHTWNTTHPAFDPVSLVRVPRVAPSPVARGVKPRRSFARLGGPLSL